MEYTVEVWGQQLKVWVDRRSPTVWVAIGSYMGKVIETKGRSARQAIGSWRDAARYRGG